MEPLLRLRSTCTVTPRPSPGQPVALAALAMTLATVFGSAIIERWGALISVVRAPACFAIASWSVAGIAWSSVPITAHDGIVFQAGAVDFSVSALVASGLWVAASTLPSAAGRPFAKQPGKTLCFT